MNARQLNQLQQLRALREERATRELAGQRQQREQADAQLSEAQQRLHDHRAALAAHAEQVFGRFSEGLSVGAWQAAQEQLEALAESDEALTCEVDAAHQHLDFHLREEDALRQQRLARQRQLEACDLLVERRQRRDLLEQERREDSDELPGPQVRP